MHQLLNSLYIIFINPQIWFFRRRFNTPPPPTPPPLPPEPTSSFVQLPVLSRGRPQQRDSLPQPSGLGGGGPPQKRKRSAGPETRSRPKTPPVAGPSGVRSPFARRSVDGGSDPPEDMSIGSPEPGPSRTPDPDAQPPALFTEGTDSDDSEDSSKENEDIDFIVKEINDNHKGKFILRARDGTKLYVKKRSFKTARIFHIDDHLYDFSFR